MFASFISTLLGSILGISVTALSAFAITIIFKTSTTCNFAQAAIAAGGCYVTAWLLNSFGIPVYFGVIPGMIVGILLGLFIDVVIFRRGKDVNHVGKQIITMGFVSLLFGGIPLIFGTPESIPFEAFYNTVKLNVPSNIVMQALGGELVLTKHALICLAITAIILGVIFILLKKSKWGLGVRCTAQSEFTAELMGIDTHVITAISWAIACALGVLAAVMYAGSGVMISTSFMTTIQVNAFLACILGGFSSFFGGILGAIIIPLLINAVGFLANFPALSGIGRYQMVIVYVIVMIIILIKPQGLLGKKVIKKV